MKANAAQIRAAIRAPSPAIRLYLLHGSDEAAAADLAAQLGAAVGSDAERIDLDGGTLRTDPARLSDEAAALSLFGTPRYVRVTALGEESAAAITALLDAERGGSPVIALAPGVRSTAKVVKLATESDRAMAFACYPPDAAGAERLATSIAGEHGLTLDHGVAARIATASGGDRAILTRETEKLALYLDAAPERPGRVDHPTLDALGAAIDEEDTGPLVAALIDGDAQQLGRQLALLDQRGVSPIPWLRQMVRRLLALAEMRAEIDRGEAVGVVMKRHRVFFREEASTAAALRRWSPEALAGAVARLRSAERTMMRSGSAGPVLAAHGAVGVLRRGERRR